LKLIDELIHVVAVGGWLFQFLGDDHFFPSIRLGLDRDEIVLPHLPPSPFVARFVTVRHLGAVDKGQCSIFRGVFNTAPIGLPRE
jgi:hypothetical protein